MNRLNRKDRETRDQAASTFETTCKKAGLNYIIHRDKGFALQELLRESIYSDLLFIDTVETFTHLENSEPTRFLTDLLTDVQCPVVITPKEFQAIDRVILLYDGKPSSVFAIKMFNYLMPWLRDLPTEVLTVVEPDELKLPEEALIKEFIKCHYPGAIYTVLHGNAKAEIVAYLKKSAPRALVVSGAYRRNTVSMWFKKSMADVLMQELEMSLFIAHNK